MKDQAFAHSDQERPLVSQRCYKSKVKMFFFTFFCYRLFKSDCLLFASVVLFGWSSRSVPC